MTTQHPSEAYRERAHDAAKDLDLHGWTRLVGAIDLAAFQAMSPDGRRAVWGQASAEDKLGLVLQILRSKDEPFDSDVINGWLEALDLRFTPAPPPALVQAVAARGAQIAQAAGDVAGMRSCDKAAYHLAQGIELARVADGVLVPSGTRAGVVYRVRDLGGTWSCSCEAAQHGRGCWHGEAAEIITTAHMWWCELLEQASSLAGDDDEEVTWGSELPPVTYRVVTVEPQTVTLGERIAAARRQWQLVEELRRAA